MAWGHSKPVPEPSKFIKLLPLIIVLIVLGVAAWIGYYIYLTSQSISNSASQRINKKNVVFTRDGVRVGVKQIQDEKYVDKTQRWVVKAWSLAKGETGVDEGDKRK